MTSKPHISTEIEEVAVACDGFGIMESAEAHWLCLGESQLLHRYTKERSLCLTVVVNEGNCVVCSRLAQTGVGEVFLFLRKEE